MTETTKIIIPMAGWATRMRPQTWSKPKPLVSVGGKTALDHLLQMFASLPKTQHSEYIFITGPYLGEQQIPAYIRENYPGLTAHYVVQAEMKGQSHALWLARQHLTGPLVICFSDTLLETDFSFLAGETSEGVAWVKPVPDPRRFGVAEVGPQGWVTRFVEKPQSLENNLVVVGCYYIRRGEQLLEAIEQQMRQNIQLKNEFFLTDALNIMIANGARIRTQTVQAWLDAGTIEATLETNRYLLEHGHADRSTVENMPGVEIRPPVFIHETAQVSHSVIGPFASIGAGCQVSHARIEDSILEPGATVESAALKGSFIGRRARVRGSTADDPPLKLNIGDDSSVLLK